MIKTAPATDSKKTIVNDINFEHPPTFPLLEVNRAIKYELFAYLATLGGILIAGKTGNWSFAAIGAALQFSLYKQSAIGHFENMRQMKKYIVSGNQNSNNNNNNHNHKI